MKNYLNNNFNLNDLPDVFDELPLWSAPFGLKLLEEVNYKKNISALDIGFGTGFPLIELAMRLGSGSKVYGIDPWSEAFPRVQKKVDYYGLGNVKLINGEAESIPLENRSVDLIVSNNGINNVKDINQVLMECSRIIKPGGQFVMTMNLDKTMIEFYILLEQYFIRMGLLGKLKGISDHVYSKRKPINKIISMLEGNGFNVESQIFDKFIYRFANGTALFNHFFIRLAFVDSWAGIMPPEKIDEIFDTIESQLNKDAEMGLPISLTIPFVTINCEKQ